ncbi:TPA: DUF443 domain-containing protein [Staphylococcus aureus]|nr:DUF443 domain-containing protein [Staphylococcus aureus]HCD2229900.1 DUF443 domain-containing protein [Staphylococcus aureus]HCD8854078.1 DUF443 domain-containing protein [Staphylococcus aureus]HDA6988743.1 DUF443 domain-containing protein [Staphylococcus aureus]HDF4607940.1 DUF443 domain-containing protein [Staphylococcus aureus]
MLYESNIINKNPRYRIIKYKNDYLMIDLVSTWLVLFFPFINWLIPKKYVQISREEFDNLNIVKPVKNKALWPVIGSILLFGTMFRDKKYIPDSHLEKNCVIIICSVLLLSILVFYIYLNQKVKLSIYNNRSSNGKIMIFPSFKNLCFVLFSYFFCGGLSIMFLDVLISLSIQNIIVFIAWVIMTMLFFFINMSSIIDKKIHVIYLRSYKY